MLTEKAITLNTPKNSSKTDQGIKNLIFGSIAGMTGKLIEYPFDTVKTRLQSQPSDHKLFKGPLDCFRQTLAHEGFFGLYRGMSPPMIGAMLENASLFLVYNHIQTIVREFTMPSYNKLQHHQQHQAPLAMTTICLAGALSGASASCFLTPIELIKCKLQVQETFTYGNRGNNISGNLGSKSTNPHYSGPWNVITHTLKNHGVKGFYCGHLGTVIRETAGTAAWFSTYEFISRLFVSYRISLKGSQNINITKNDLSAIELMSAGACAGMAYNLLIFPVDSIKSQMQTDEEVMIATGKKVIKRGFWQVGREIYKSDGINGFYRGCGITVARAAPSSAIIFMTYELLVRHFS